MHQTKLQGNIGPPLNLIATQAKPTQHFDECLFS
jgi:hypothetical protein